MNWEAPTCVICLQDLSNNLSSLSCGHVFHHECISQCISNKTKNCPLCREKIYPSKITIIQFSLNQITSTCKSLGLNEEESNDIKVLQSKLKEVLNECNDLKYKLQTYENKEVVFRTQIETLRNEATKNNDKAQVFEEKYRKTREALNEQEYEAEKYKGLFKNTNKKNKELEDKVGKFEGISRLIAEIESNQSSVTWANNARETLPLEDQASQFYSALLIATTTLKAQEKSYKELKSQHGLCSEEIGKLKKANSLLRKENEKIHSGKPTITTEFKRNIDQAFPMVIDNGRNLAPKKTLSLLNRN